MVLTGGGGARLGGADKASIELAGQTLLERSLRALTEVPQVVVVGDSVLTSRPVRFLREDPPGGGPAAGLLAGLTGFPRTPRLVVVLAVDMPLVTAATVRRLILAVAGPGDPDGCPGGYPDGYPDSGPGGDPDGDQDGGPDGAVLLDGDGRRQYLCAAYRAEALLAAAPDPPGQHGLPVKRLLADLELVEVPAVADEAQDLDTWEDLLMLRDRFEP